MVVRKITDREIWDDIDSAWCLNLDTGRFEVLSSDEVSGINQGVGA